MLIIALIDKYPILRLGLTFCLKQHFSNFTVKESNNIIDYHTFFDAEKPDLIIQGINEDSMESNVDAVERIRGYYPNIPVIIYDENPLNFHQTSFLKSGINGYVLKQNHVNELLTCIEAVLQGKYYFSPQVHENSPEAIIKDKNGIIAKQDHPFRNKNGV